MNSSEMEKKATQKARTVDPHDLPFPTSVDDWQTWVSDQGAWIFIDKAVVAAIAAAYAYDNEQAFQWVGARMLEWLTDNPAKLKPRQIWEFKFAGVKGNSVAAVVNFAVFNNKCFVFMPGKLNSK